MTQFPEIIAEAGSNHNGDPARACQLIDLAAQAGASSIKFQFIYADGLYLPDYPEHGPDGAITYSPSTVFAQRRREEMSDTDWQTIWDHAARVGITVSASVFCERGIALLKRLGAPYVKIASTDLTNHALIARACESFPRVIVSTGMATMGEIEAMVTMVKRDHPGTDFSLMHCVSAYPCDLAQANTGRVALLARAFEVPVGYSDHTGEDISAAMALVQGASFFEKHFTTDRSLPGFDHAHALDGPALQSYVAHLRAAAQSLAQPAAGLARQELVTKVRARRGLYAARDLPAGHVLTADDLLFVRPSTAFQATDPAQLVGQRLTQDVPRHAALGPGAGVGTVASNWGSAGSYWGQEMQEKGMTPAPANADTAEPQG